MVHNDYYVYLHRRGDNNEVFYVGKGRRYRANSKSNRNLWWCNIVNKCGFVVEFVEKGLSEEDAFTLEIELIKFYKENNHTLCNISDGGEGASGVVRKQPLVDGKMIDLNVRISTATKNRTRRWLHKNKIALDVLLTNLLLYNKVYYNRNKNKAEKSKENKRGISNYSIICAIDYLVKEGIVVNYVTSIKDSVKTLSYIEATPLLEKLKNNAVVKEDVSC